MIDIVNTLCWLDPSLGPGPPSMTFLIGLPVWSKSQLRNMFRSVMVSVACMCFVCRGAVALQQSIL